MNALKQPLRKKLPLSKNLIAVYNFLCYSLDFRREEMEHPAEEFYEMRAIVKGHVQGIGFRALTRSYAHQLGLTGMVRNLSDGSVEIYAQGPKPLLEELIRHLNKEMPPGLIEDIALEYLPIEHVHDDFRIIH